MSTTTNNQAIEEPAVSRAVIPILATTAMLGMLNIASMGPLMAEISRDLMVSAPLLGQITAAIFMGSAVIGLFAGPLGDEYGKKRLIVMGLVIVSISAFGTVFAPTYGWLFAARVLSAFSGGLLTGTTLAIAGTLFSGARRRAAMGSIASGIALGPIIGIPALTLVASWASWRASYGVISGLGLISALLAYRYLVDDSNRSAGRFKMAKFQDAYRPLLRDRAMTRLYTASMIRAIGWVGMLTYLGAYLGQGLGLSVSRVGVATMIAGLGYFAGTKIAGGPVGDVNPRMLYGAATFACGVFLGLGIALPLGPTPAVTLLTVAAMSGGIGWVALISLISSESPAGQGTTMSLNSSVFTFGSAIGGAAGGVLLALGGYTGLGLGLMGFIMFAGGLVWRPNLRQVLAHLRNKEETMVAPATHRANPITAGDGE